MPMGFKNKLKSEKGASLSMSLLLFLICAIVSSVVLVAGTAASGRMSGMADSDQRYYSVTSAAGLLKDLMNNKTVSVKRTVVKKQKKKYNGGTVSPDGTPVNVSDGTVVSMGADTVTINSTYNGNDIDTTVDPTGGAMLKNSFPVYAAFKLIQTSKVDSANASYTPGAITDPIEGKTFSITGSGELSAAVTAEEIIRPDGTIIFDVYNGDKGAAEDKYCLRLIFEADRDETTDSRSADGPRENVSGTGGSLKYDFSTTTTTITTTTITWRLASITTL